MKKPSELSKTSKITIGIAFSPCKAEIHAENIVFFAIIFSSARGLKCGGTAHERAERLFSVKDLQPKNYPKNLLANGGKKGNK